MVLGCQPAKKKPPPEMTAAEYKAEREKLGTTAEVAAMLGIARETVSRRENGAKITREAELAIKALKKPKTR
jgi:DNA-binding transcriptional regulator YiaG